MAKLEILQADYNTLSRTVVLFYKVTKLVRNTTYLFTSLHFSLSPGRTPTASAAPAASASACVSFPPDDLTEKAPAGPKYTAGYDDIYEKILYTHNGKGFK